MFLVVEFYCLFLIIMFSISSHASLAPLIKMIKTKIPVILYLFKPSIECICFRLRLVILMASRVKAHSTQ